MSQHLKHTSAELNGGSLQVSIQWSSPSLRFSSAAGMWQWLPGCRSISEGNSGSQLLIELTNTIKGCSVPLVGNEQPTSVHMCSDFYGRVPAPKTRSSLTPTM